MAPASAARRIAGRDACPRQKKFRSATSPPAARASPAPFLLALPTKPKCGFAGAPARQASAPTGRFCVAFNWRSHGTVARLSAVRRRGCFETVSPQRGTRRPTPRFTVLGGVWMPPGPQEGRKRAHDAKWAVMHRVGHGRGRFPVPAAPTAAGNGPPKHLGTGRRY